MRIKKRILGVGYHLFVTVLTLSMCLPLYLAFVAATHTTNEIMQSPMPLLPGSHLIENFLTILTQGSEITGGSPVWHLLWNSFLIAVVIAVGKVVVSFLSAYAFVYYRFPLRRLCFWMIFCTLMLPIEVRTLPTFHVVANIQMLNSMSAISLPLIASATATFLFRQFFLTIPNDLVDAAKMDGAGPIRFFVDIILPLSKVNLAALFIIMFIYGWNQYLWPLVVNTDVNAKTIMIGIQELMSVADQIPQWNTIMVTAILAMVPPVFVVVAMQRLLQKGLTGQ